MSWFTVPRIILLHRLRRYSIGTCRRSVDNRSLLSNAGVQADRVSMLLSAFLSPRKVSRNIIVLFRENLVTKTCEVLTLSVPRLLTKLTITRVDLLNRLWSTVWVGPTVNTLH